MPYFIQGIAVLCLLLLPRIGSAELASVDDMLADRILGDPAAPVTILDYSSMTCPHCASFHNETLPRITEEYIDTGKARLIFRDFPFGLLAKAAAMVSRCVDKDSYYGFLTVLFRSQDQWSQSKEPAVELERMARFAGLSKADFEACLSNQALVKGIEENAAKAHEELGIESTPTFFISGKEITGAAPFDQFKTAIDEALEKANQ